MEKNPKSESNIESEAENIIAEYVKNREKNNQESIFQEKYERLKILSIALGIVGSLGILVSIILK